MDSEIRSLIIEAIDEIIHPNPSEIPEKWEGGTLVLKPGNDSQEKEIPLDVFIKKIVTVRDSLRVLEQKINTHKKLSPEEKLTFQGYITKAYGTLTTFNILFKADKDRFVGAGSGGKKKSGDAEMSVKEAQQKLGLNEY